MDPQLGVDGESAPLTSVEAQGVLTVVNTATFVELDDDVPLDVRAARNIVAYRDVQAIGTIAELDGIRYVGPSALGKLLAYAYENGYVDTAPAGDCLIISEYIEAWGNYNKAVELFNCGTAPLALSDYSLCLVRNSDTTCSRTVTLDGGELAPDAVHTVCRRKVGHPASIDPAAPITDNCDQQAAGVMTFSGDDRLLVLERGSERVADAFGVAAERPSWSRWANRLYRRCDFEPFDGTSFDLARFSSHTSGDMSDFGTAPLETCANK